MLHCKPTIGGAAGGVSGDWPRVIGTTFALQFGLTALVASLAYAWGGRDEALAALWGGGAIAVPNAAVAMVLWFKASRLGVLGVFHLLLAEGLKLAYIGLALFVAARHLGNGPGWLGLLAGVVAALKAQWLAMWFTRKG
jgi:F0F1-type ATP synthase assembly protein I